MELLTVFLLRFFPLFGRMLQCCFAVKTRKLRPTFHRHRVEQITTGFSFLVNYSFSINSLTLRKDLMTGVHGIHHVLAARLARSVIVVQAAKWHTPTELISWRLWPHMTAFLQPSSPDNRPCGHQDSLLLRIHSSCSISILQNGICLQFVQRQKLVSMLRQS